MLPASAAEIDQLRQQLHDANQRYHHARREWEKWLDASEFRHEAHVDSAREKLQNVESELEAMEERIRRALRPEPAPAVHAR